MRVGVLVGLLIGLLTLCATAQTAEARVRLFSSDDQIVDLGVMPDELRERYRGDGDFDTVGFHYKRFAILSADVWSWSGSLVFYRKRPEISLQGFRTIETTYFTEIDDDVADAYGWKAPIEYRIPVGLLVASCVVELAIVARKRRNAKRVLALGIGFVVFAGVLFLLGMTWQCAFPLVVGVFHIVSALPIFAPASNVEAALAMKPLVADDKSSDEDPPYKKPADERSSRPLLPPAPSFEKDPFRAPPQPPPIIVKRPPTAPSTAPVVRDEHAEAPKLLR